MLVNPWLKGIYFIRSLNKRANRFNQLNSVTISKLVLLYSVCTVNILQISYVEF